MRTRGDVLREFSRPYQSHEDVGGYDVDAMADRIRELEARASKLMARNLDLNLERARLEDELIRATTPTRGSDE